ncbi:MAG: hypothetical protein C5B51_11150 [Terriglobia bacterium]|nr:MAG: hypothetical protein C5B51_11150 [Terriglobia bacterium]
MRSRNRRGVSSIEFAFCMLILLPLLLGTGVTGIDMILTLQTVQLARDVGHMYARDVNFAQPGNMTIVGNLGSSLGLSTTPGSGTAVVILSALTYVDVNACAAVGAVDGNGNPTSACTNYQKWVFTQRVLIGNQNVRSSNYGSPITSGPTGVTVDPVTGKITQSDYVKKAGAVANFSGVNPYQVINGQAQGLPSGQVLYLAEAGATGFNMPPFVSNATTYSFNFF